MTPEFRTGYVAGMKAAAASLATAAADLQRGNPDLAEFMVQIAERMWGSALRVELVDTPPAGSA